ncbi:UNVERIFIED_CONTAM: hypothetical protein HDU68_003655 [Siphonaria sp. JEL0065]|nr:hypothetical protein HDU68_003655 [Siphonaria sp. JEL0065]
MTGIQVDFDVVIVGGGIAGLTLANALAKHVGVKVVVFEQTKEASFGEGTGGAIGLYANGLQVLRDIDSQLLDGIVAEGMPYSRRRWLRHDGSEFANADETLLVPPQTTPDSRLQPIGIRRWRFQNQLFLHAQKQGIQIHFGKRLSKLEAVEGGNLTRLCFVDGQKFVARLVFGADGVKSQVRDFLFPEAEPPKYTGVTTLMAVSRSSNPPSPADNPPPLPQGIHFISSVTSKFHACMYPLPNNETNVQIYLPTPENPESWGKLTPEETKREARAMELKLRKDGWSETFIEPWKNPESVIRVGLRARSPLEKWAKGNVVLLGDAAHPPVPYIGQGAMQAIEDAGVLALLMKKLCVLKPETGLDLKHFDLVTRLYEQIRVGRCTEVLKGSHVLGEMNQRRADSWFYNLQYEWTIWGQVLRDGHLPIMKLGVCYDYRKEVENAVSNVQAKL